MNAHNCPGPSCHPYPSFDDDPARWGLREPPALTAAEAQAAEEMELWGLQGPPTAAEWAAEVQTYQLEAGL
jgi:hypothetical protein